MKTKSISALRDQIQRNTKKELFKLENKHGVKITIAAKRELVSGISRVFRENSPDLARVVKVRVTERKRYKMPKRKYGTVLVEDELNAIKKTKDSLAEVVKVAAQIAKKESPRNIITVQCVDSAITKKWCEIWPVCNVRTSRKLGLPIRKEDNNE